MKERELQDAERIDREAQKKEAERLRREKEVILEMACEAPEEEKDE